MKRTLTCIAGAVLAAACATAPEAPKVAQATPPPAAPAKKECAEPPKELVKKDLVVGTGKEVVLRSPTYVEYTGWLYDGCAPDFKGKQFDTSQGRQTPFGFVAGGGRVIKGWDEGVMGMRERGTRLLIIPPDKGYGAQGAGNGLIPPNATLVFEVSVLNILQ